MGIKKNHFVPIGLLSIILIITIQELHLSEKVGTIIYPNPTDVRSESSAQKMASTSKKAIISQVQQNEEQIELPSIDHKPLIRKALRLEERGISRFATSRNVNIRPVTHGAWTVDRHMSHWTLDIKSKGAESLNLAFTEFHLPENSSLQIDSITDNSGPIHFTESDNEDHGQLWTPLFKSDNLSLKLSAPTHLVADIKMNITKVNHGFRSAGSHFKISNNTSGDCQIDVICSAADNSDYGPLIDIFRDQIKSVGAYTLNGVDTCSGALINNTRNDLRPFFLTAEHCGISPSNAASMVVYWNHENTSCRAVGSVQNRQEGDGPTTQFNTGAILRAEHAPSDFALVELDDPINTDHGPFFAGWNRSPENPEMTIGIHHPGVSEKRISFDMDPTTITDFLSARIDNNAKFLRIGAWDFGTTEPGSSGSALFDDKGRIIGQLTGGYSECGGDLGPDYYGRLHTSWTGGGTPSTRLSDWLDPIGSGASSLSGIYSNELITISGASAREGNAGTTIIEAELKIGEPSSGPIQVTVRSIDGTATVQDNDYIPVNRIVTFEPGQTVKKVTAQIIGDSVAEENETFLLALFDPRKSLAASTPASIEIINDDFITPTITSELNITSSTNLVLSYRITGENTPTSYGISDGPDGMEINTQTGEINWVPTSTGTFSVKIIAENSAGSDLETLTIRVEADSLSNAIEIQELPVLLSNASPGWFRQTNTSHDGSDAARPEPIDSNQSASFSIEVSGPDLVYYWWKVSSEEDYDLLSVDMDGEIQDQISGEVGWEQKTITIPAGNHTISWTYSKDVSGTGGLDTAWVDEVSLSSRSLDPTITSPLELITVRGKEFNYKITSIDASSSYFVSSLPDGLEFDGKDTISGKVSEKGNYSIMLTADNGNRFSANLTLQVVDSVDDAIQGTDPSLGKFNFQGSGDKLWFPQSQVSHDGKNAAQSGLIKDQEESSVSVNVSGPATLSFWWKVSSETGYDFLSFSIDGIIKDSISGEVDWTLKTFNVPEGNHTLTWTYSKDEGLSEGQDTAWIDDFKLIDKATPIITVNNDYSFYLAEKIIIPFSIENNSVPVSFDRLPEWLVHNNENGSLSGNAPSPGNYEFAIIAQNGNETITERVRITVIWPIGESLEQPEWTASGNSFWFPQSEITHDGSDAAQSGKISAREQSTISIKVTGPATVSFWWKVSSEPDYDYLSVFLDEQILQHRISGEVNWEKKEINVPEGEHSVSWTYSKDVALSEGDDAGWLDQVEIISPLSPVISISTELSFNQGENIVIPFSVENGPVTIGFNGLPEWISYVPESGALKGTAPEPGTYNFSVWAENDIGRITKEVTLVIIKAVENPSDDLDWQVSGDTNWFSQSEFSHDGESAGQSGAITDMQSSTISFELTGPAKVSFWWKVSSEFEYDFLSVRLDGEYIEYISGEVNWEQSTINVPEGSHLISFTYSKDVNESSGLDAGWVDEVTVIRDGNPVNERVTSIEILEASTESIRIGARISSDSARARIARSSDGKSWEPTGALSGNETLWLQRPANGWDKLYEVTVPISPREIPQFLLRIETEAP